MKVTMVMLAAIGCAVALSDGRAEDSGPNDGDCRILLELGHTEQNPRNSEGDLLWLKDGRYLFVYTKFEKAEGSAFGGSHDHAPARICARISSDKGVTWSDDRILFSPRKGDLNVMSVSLLRLDDGSLACFFCRKRGVDDCRPEMSVSTDEGATWSEPRLCVSERAYYVMNNARVVQLKSGRLVLPLARHGLIPKEMKSGLTHWSWATLLCAISDDRGRTWRLSQARVETRDGQFERVVTQEPGLVEMKDGRLMMYARTERRGQWCGYSSDGGETWTKFRPFGPVCSAHSPMSIARLSDGRLVAAWCDPTLWKGDGDEKYRPTLYEKRSPMCLAVSSDEGRTWRKRKVFETEDDTRCACYFALRELDGRLVMAYCSRDGLRTLRISSVPFSWLDADVAKPLD